MGVGKKELGGLVVRDQSTVLGTNQINLHIIMNVCGYMF